MINIRFNNLYYFDYGKMSNIVLLCVEIPMICGNCGKSASNFCGGCGNVRYCSKECQIIVRKVHKIVCVKKNDLPSLLEEETNEEESEILPVSIDYREVMDLSNESTNAITHFISTGKIPKNAQIMMNNVLEKSYSWIKRDEAIDMLNGYLKNKIIDISMYSEHLEIIERVCLKKSSPIVNNNVSFLEVSNFIEKSVNAQKDLTCYGKKHRFFTLCEICHSPSKKKCSICLKSYYCSKNCQISHWSEHKKVCNI